MTRAGTQTQSLTFHDPLPALLAKKVAAEDLPAERPVCSERQIDLIDDAGQMIGSQQGTVWRLWIDTGRRCPRRRARNLGGRSRSAPGLRRRRRLVAPSTSPAPERESSDDRWGQECFQAASSARESCAYPSVRCYLRMWGRGAESKRSRGRRYVNRVVRPLFDEVVGEAIAGAPLQRDLLLPISLDRLRRLRSGPLPRG